MPMSAVGRNPTVFLATDLRVTSSREVSTALLDLCFVVGRVRTVASDISHLL